MVVNADDGAIVVSANGAAGVSVNGIVVSVGVNAEDKLNESESGPSMITYTEK